MQEHLTSLWIPPCISRYPRLSTQTFLHLRVSLNSCEMGITSNTGLLASVPNPIRRIAQEPPVQFPNAARPAPFVLRPFAGVYNPFPYGCSIMCNHPADFEAKRVVKRAKHSWACEGKTLVSADELAALSSAHNQAQAHEHAVPEELFRRYTDTDSRPPTPAPTLASGARSSAARRRCVTPDGDADAVRKRTTLVLDLRRSQSQDTLSLQGLSVPPSAAPPAPRTPSPSRGPAPSHAQAKKKAGPSGKKAPPAAEVESPSDKRHKTTPKSPLKAMPPPDIKLHAVESAEDEDSPKRRGKRRKGKKSAGDGDGEPDKGFKGLPEPGDTQVSTLGDELDEPVSRPSAPSALSGDEATTPDCIKPTPPEGGTTPSFGGSFIVAAILKQLRRGLNHEMIDGVFDPRRKLALVEAIRSWPSGRRPAEGKGIKVLRKRLQLAGADDTWLAVPRVFSRQSARFELPLDSRNLNTMTPMEYASGHVAVTSSRRQLYNRVFNRHRDEADDDDELVDRRLSGVKVHAALRDVLGQPVPPDEAQRFQGLLGWGDAFALDFRAWCGVAACAERILGPSLMAAPDRAIDPCHEVEEADFESLPCRLRGLHVDPRLAELLAGIRNL